MKSALWFTPKNILQFLFSLTMAILVYVITAKLGLKLATINNSASPVWPATGLAIYILYAHGYRLTPAIWLAAVLANLGTGVSLAAVVTIATGNTLEAVTAVYILHRMRSTSWSHSALFANALIYSALALLPTTISATFGTMALFFSGAIPASNVWTNWATWWIGDALGALLVFTILDEFRQWNLKPAWKNLTSGFSITWTQKFLVVTAAVATSSFVVFGTATGGPYLFLIFFALLFAAYLLSPLFIYAASIYVSVYSILMTAQGLGPFQSGESNVSLMHLEFFLGSVWLTAIILTTLKKNHSLYRPTWAFAIGWFLTGTAFYSFYQTGVSRQVEYYDFKLSEAKSAISETMNNYIRLLEAGAGLMNAKAFISPEEWAAFTSGLKLNSRYQGIKGVGVIYAVPGEDLASFQNRYQKLFPDFKIHAVSGDKTQAQGTHYVISLIEPLDPNRPALGLDIASETYRREAAERAASTGEAALTKELRLVQSANNRFGYLLLVPFYEKNKSSVTASNGKPVLRGFVYAPIEGESFFEAATKSFEAELTLVDFYPLSRKKYSMVSSKGPQILESTVDLAGNPHQLLWRPASNQFRRLNMDASLAGFCGAFFTLVLAILVASTDGIRREAQKIADLKTAEVKERERIWRTLTENSPIGIFLIGADNKVTYANQKWSQITGFDLSDLQAGKFQDAVHPEDRDSVYSAWRDFIESRINEYKYSYRMYVGGNLRHVACHVVSMRSGQNDLVGYLGTLQDVTEQNENQLALATAARLSSIGQMAGGIAHEINSPLAIIAGRADLLKILIEEPALDKEQARSHVEKINITVTRIAKIIKGLRSVSRDIPSGSHDEFSLLQTIQDTLELCERRFLDNKVDFRFEKDTAKNILCEGRPEQVSQVLLNLLNNAFDAVAGLNEKWVQMQYFERNGFVCLEITDSGHGISDKDQKNLFNAFFTTKQVGQGMGLGLSISRSIAEKNGGRLYYDKSRKNTTFVFEIKKSTAATREVA